MSNTVHFIGKTPKNTPRYARYASPCETPQVYGAPCANSAHRERC